MVLCANDYGNEVTAGRYDAMNGLLLLGDGNDSFNAQTMQQSGFCVPGDAKALIQLRGTEGVYLLAASQNQGAIKLFKERRNATIIGVKGDDSYALIKLKSGKVRKQELYYGSSFLSQSARFVVKDTDVQSITIVNTKGVKRIIQ